MTTFEDVDDDDHGSVPPDLLELFEALEHDAQSQGFEHLNELREVLIFEGKLDPDE